MKKSTALTSLFKATTIVILSVLVALSACDPKKDPSPKEAALQRLISGPWVLNTLTIDNVDQTSQFSGLTLSFTATNYSTTNGKAPVWPSSGTWAFKDDTGKSIVRDGSLDVTVSELIQNTLEVTFTMSTTYGGGRVSSLGGNYKCRFTK